MSKPNMGPVEYNARRQLAALDSLGILQSIATAFPVLLEKDQLINASASLDLAEALASLITDAPELCAYLRAGIQLDKENNEGGSPL